MTTAGFQIGRAALAMCAIIYARKNMETLPGELSIRARAQLYLGNKGRQRS